MSNRDNSYRVLYDIMRSVMKEKKREYFGRVVDVRGDSKTAYVDIAGCGVMNLLNKSGERLTNGDSVFIYAIGGDLSNAFIMIRYGESNININSLP